MKNCFYRKLFWRSCRWGHTGMTKKRKISVYQKIITLVMAFTKIFLRRSYQWQCRATTIEKINFIEIFHYEGSFQHNTYSEDRFNGCDFQGANIKKNYYERSFLLKIILKNVSMWELRNDGKNQKLETFRKTFIMKDRFYIKLFWSVSMRIHSSNVKIQKLKFQKETLYWKINFTLN